MSNETTTRHRGRRPESPRPATGDWRHDEPNLKRVVILQQEVDQFGLREFRRHVLRFQQQEFSHFMRLSSAFRRFNGAKLLALMGLILLLIGIALEGLTQSTYRQISYTAGDESQDFEVLQEGRGPFYVYAQLENFYANSRLYRDSVPEYFGKHKCGAYKTVESALYIRPIDSMPELAGMAPEAPLHPCGMQSIAYMNDEFQIQDLTHCQDASPDDCTPRNMTLSTANISPPALFNLYGTAEPDDKMWIRPLLQTRIQGWYFSPFTSSSLLFIGTLREFILNRGKHRILFTKNVWPDNLFGAKKSLLIMTRGRLGSSQKFLAIVTIVWGLGLIGLACLFLWALRRDVIFSSSTVSDVPSEELQEQWIKHTQDWLVARTTNLETRRRASSNRDFRRSCMSGGARPSGLIAAYPSNSAG